MNRWISPDHGDFDLFQSTSYKVVITTSVIYVLWHIIATLGYPEIFSPSLWICTTIMILTVGSTIQLLKVSFLTAQITWFFGLTITTLAAFIMYQRPEILLILVFLPMMAEVMIGIWPAFVLECLLILLFLFSNALSFLPVLPVNNMIILVIASISTTLLGWSLSNNLVSALEAASFHYQEAIRRLEETRQNRAEISSLLKEVNKANFQLSRLNQMLSVARAHAEDAREERDRFALAVSHELRSPLNFIIGFSDLMVNAPGTYANLDEWPSGLYNDIKEIYQSSTHLMALINDILDMGKMDAQYMALFKEKVELSQIFDEVIGMIKPGIEKKGLYLKRELDPGIPSLYVDHTRIRQALLNLLTNSLRFTHHGGITLRGFITPDQLLRVEVDDTGEGISLDDLPKVFSEFRQAGNQNWQRREGTGLGLVIGKRFIQLHGGDMGVESQLGKGSCFYFTLPLDGSNEISLPSLEYSSEKVPEGSQESTFPLLLLLVRDPFWMRNFADNLKGYKYFVLDNPDLLLETVSQTYPWAVIIDPGLFPHPTIQTFIKDPPYDIPVIVLPVPKNINRVTNLPDGVTAYLGKPIQSQKVVDTLHSLNIPINTLLVVDDDDTMAHFIHQSLRSAKGGNFFKPGETRILSAVGGIEALDYLKSEKIDVIFVDLDLPDMNGYLLIDILQKEEEYQSIPIVIVSASDMSQNPRNQEQSLIRISQNRLFSQKELVSILTTTLSTLSPEYPEKTGPVSEKANKD